MARFFLLMMALAGALCAQQVVAPTPEQVGPPRGENTGNYNITNSFETGYRFAVVAGDENKYRADVNYGNGIRLLGSSLSVDSKDGHGHLFDQILLNTQGLGNDPYESVTLRVQKNGLYLYDMRWRLNDFFNPGLTISAGLHRMDTSRHLQDHDLTLLPQSRIRFRVGYSRDTQSGPALSSVQEFNATGYAFPVFMNVRRDWNEYRVGADADFAGFKFTFLHRWNYFKDDTPYGPVASAPPPPGDTGKVALQQFARSEPIHGSNPGWFGNLFTNRKYWGIDARITYNSGRNDFVLNEQATGIPFTGIIGATPLDRQIVVGGAAQRPVTAGDFNLSVYPTDKLTIVNQTAVHSTRIQGDSTYSEYDNGTGFGATLNFRYLGIRTVSNTTDANYRLAPWISFYAGYSYSDRLVRTIEGFAFGGGAVENTEYERENQLHSGTVGVQIRPWKPLTIRVNGEIGRDNLPLTPISDRNYHTIGGRIDYRTRKVQLSGTYSQVYNVNSSDPLSAYSSHTRNYTANASWSPVARWSLDASYMKLHLDTVSTLAFFAGVNSVQSYQGFSQLYVSNIHAVNFAWHFAATRRVDLYVGYSLTKDTGDGRSAAVPPGITNPATALFASVQTFPLSFQSPLARLSVRITPKIRWNAGWQFYNYHQQFALLTYVQNYHANTGYTSVLWSF